jgi:hypothetical protein
MIGDDGRPHFLVDRILASRIDRPAQQRPEATARRRRRLVSLPQNTSRHQLRDNGIPQARRDIIQVCGL